MKFNKKWISMILITAILVTSLPAMAGNGVAMGAKDSNDGSTITKVVAVAVTVIAAVFIGRKIKNNKKKDQAREFYEKGNIYAEQGSWDRAVAAYKKARNHYPEYKDVAAKLILAKSKAEEMFIKKGDKAREQEKYEEAIAFYQKALNYNPTSLTAKKKMETLSTDLVDVYYRRGYKYEIQGKWQAAYNEYKKAFYYNPQYKDLADRYNRAKAKINGNLPLRGILFFVNHTNQRGIEKPLIHELQAQLEGEVSSQFYLIDQKRVQNIMNEQADALGDELDSNLAIDLGQVMGVDEVLIGDINSIYTKRNRLRMELSLEIINVESGNTIRTIDYTHKFSKDVTEENIIKALPEMVEELVERIVD
mgnify:FL=1